METIIEAVSTQVWSCDAVVHVSLVNWIKGEQPGKKKLYTQLGDDKDSPWKVAEFDYINSALSHKIDVTQAKNLSVNINPKSCDQGQTHGHDGFLLTPSEAIEFIQQSSKNSEVLFYYFIGEDLLDNRPPRTK